MIIGLNNIGGGGSADNSKYYLYKDGVWNVGYDNPGGYTNGSMTMFGWTLESNKMSASNNSGTSSYMIGSSSSIDTSSYSSIHIVSKGTKIYNGECLALTVQPNKQFSSRVLHVKVTTVDQTVDYAGDISTLSGSYYIAIMMGSSRSGEVYEIYLSK